MRSLIFSTLILSLSASCVDNANAPRPLEAPLILESAAGDRSLSLSWNEVDNATAYRIYVSTEPLTDYLSEPNFEQVRATTFTRQQLANGTPYTVSVVATDGWNLGPATTILLTPLPPPTACDVSINQGAIFTTVPRVTASFTAEGATEMQISLSRETLDNAPWEPFETERNLDLPVGDGPREVWARFRNANALSCGPVSDTIVIDSIPPDLRNLRLDPDIDPWTHLGSRFGHPEYVATRHATAMIDADFLQEHWVAMWLSWTPNFTDGFWEPIDTARDLQLPDQDGAHQLYVQFRDAAGNVYGDAGDVSSNIVILDRVAPYDLAVSINGGAEATSDVNVTLELAATHADLMWISNESEFILGDWEPYAPTKAWVLTAGDEGKSIYAKFATWASLESQAFPPIIRLDTVAPIGELELVSQEGNKDLTKRQDVVANITAVGDATEMRLCNDPAFVGCNWVAVQESVPWTLTTGDGNKTVSLQLRDAAGNVGGVAPQFQDAIFLDETAPSITNASLLTSSPTNHPTIQLDFSADDGTGSGVVGYFVSESPIPPAVGDAWLPVAPSSFTLSLGDGLKRVYVWAIDAVGFVSAVQAPLEIELDMTPPEDRFRINDGAIFTNDPSVTIGFTDPVADAFEMWISESATFATGAWQAYTPTFPWTLSSGDGLKVVYIQIRDQAGNVTGGAGDMLQTIFLDTTPPEVSAVRILESPVTNRPRVTTVISATDSGSGVRSWHTTHITAQPAAADFIATTNPVSHTLAAAPTGTSHDVYGWAIDAAGNVSTDLVFDSIIMQITDPDLAILDGDGYTNSLAVPVELYLPSWVQDVRLSDGGSVGPWQPAALSVTWTFSAGEGPRTLQLETRNSSQITFGQNGEFVDSTFVDTLAPTVTTFSVDSADPTNDPSLALTTTAADPGFPATGSGIQAYAIQRDDTTPPLSTAAVWQSSAPSAYLLDLIQGSRSLSLWVRDEAGNVSPVQSASTFLDTIPPVSNSFAIGTASPTRQTSASVAGTGSDPGFPTTGSGIVGYMVTDTGTVPAVTDPRWTPITPASAALTADGLRTVRYWIKDAAGNVAQASTEQIFRDTRAPSVSVFNASYTNRPTRSNLGLNQTDPAPSGGGFTWVVSTSGSTPARSAFGNRPAQFNRAISSGRYLYAWVMDSAGNMSARSRITHWVPHRSCWWYDYYHGNGAPTGNYYLDPDVNGSGTPYLARCEQDSDGGGWTLVGTMANDSHDYWSWSRRDNLWNSSTFGSLGNYRLQDFKSRTWSEVDGNQIMLKSKNNMYIIEKHVITDEPLSSAWSSTVVESDTWTIDVVAGSWYYQCDANIRLMLMIQDDDGNCGSGNDGWAQGFVFRSSNNCGCDYDDVAGGLNPSLYANAEHGWTYDFFYTKNFVDNGPGSVRIYVR